ncbi:MAG: Holliday junction branch migration protein RuvA [Coriobacteriales bacterium]|jgi:Holliday junction DNA helicase RuvA|nr:Holliday junction branch migration protein RuvA [Coriobacteriales bacterium]
MIAQLKGTVVALTESSVVIDVGGVGFAITASTPTLASLHGGKEVLLQTMLVVRDDALTLYGFISPAERRLFEQLIAISGVGPKAALSLLSSLQVDDLRLAIAQGDVNLIATAPGIGKKTAQRVIVELKGAFEQAIAEAGRAVPLQSNREVTEALLTMGFTTQEATLAVKGYDGDPADSNGLLRYALKRLGK